MKGEEELSFLSEQDLNDHMDGNYPSANPVGETTSRVDNFSSKLNEIGFLRNSSHPITACFHLLFKTVALLLYLFSGMFTSNYIFVAVLVILLLAFDFWTVKNVTGRLLVGLRWWSHVREDGSNEWVFESLENMNEVNPNDSRVFWFGLYAPVGAWGGLLVIDLLKFNLQWLVVVAAALAMSMANVVGYTKCSSDAKKKMQGLLDQGSAGLGVMAAFGQSSGVQSALSGLFNILGGGGGSNTAAADVSVSV